MAVSEYDRHGLLNIWRERMQANIWHFNQAAGAGAPLRSPNVLWIQDDRDEFASALQFAFDKMAEHLNYFPLPIWHSEKIPLGRRSPFEFQPLQTRYQKIEALGQRGSTLIEADVAVVYSDTTGDGVNDTATITVATTETAGEVKAFFRTGDGAPSAGNEWWEIRPLTAATVGANVVLTGSRALFVEPDDFWQTPYDPTDPNYLEKNQADTEVAADFVTQVDIYRVFNDTTTTVTLAADPIWTEGSDWASEVTYAGQGYLLEPQRGTIRARATSTSCPRAINSAIVYYKSGEPLVNSRMNTTLRDTLVHLTNATAGRPLCTFEGTLEDMFQDDRRFPDALPASLQGNPFGELKGHVRAWRTVRVRRQEGRPTAGGLWG